MKSKLRGIVSILLVLVMVLGFSGCYNENNTWAAKKDDVTLPIGGYIYYLNNAYSQARALVPTETQVLKSTIEDQDAETWIRNKAKESINQYFYIQDKFKELGLELTEEEISMANQTTTSYWSYYSNTFEPLGISRDSFNQVFALFSTMSSKVFEALYSPDGEFGISDEDLTSFYVENYFSYEYFTASTQKKDDSGTSVDMDEDEKSALKEKLEAYKEQIESGEITLSAAAENYEKENEITTSTYTSSTINKEKASGDILEGTLKLNDNQVEIIETSTSYALVKKIAISDKTSTMLETSTERLTILSDLKSEEYSKYIEDNAAEITGIEFNESAMKNYKLKKIVSDSNKEGTSSVASEAESSSVSSKVSDELSSDVSSEASSEVSDESSEASQDVSSESSREESSEISSDVSSDNSEE